MGFLSKLRYSYFLEFGFNFVKIAEVWQKNGIQNVAN